VGDTEFLAQLPGGVRLAVDVPFLMTIAMAYLLFDFATVLWGVCSGWSAASNPVLITASLLKSLDSIGHSLIRDNELARNL
jgi:hypothetical protein